MEMRPYYALPMYQRALLYELDLQDKQKAYDDFKAALRCGSLPNKARHTAQMHMQRLSLELGLKGDEDGTPHRDRERERHSDGHRTTGKRSRTRSRSRSTGSPHKRHRSDNSKSDVHGSSSKSSATAEVKSSKSSKSEFDWSNARHWGVDEVESWLKSIGSEFSACADSAKRFGLTGEFLLDLDSEGFGDLSVQLAATTPLLQRRLLHDINKMRHAASLSSLAMPRSSPVDLAGAGGPNSTVTITPVTTATSSDGNALPTPRQTAANDSHSSSAAAVSQS